jgi:hypothetical protein
VIFAYPIFTGTYPENIMIGPDGLWTVDCFDMGAGAANEVTRAALQGHPETLYRLHSILRAFWHFK